MATKNIFKATLMLAILFASSVTFAQGQNMQKRTPEERAQNQTAWMKQNLGITDDQNKKAYDIILNAAKQVDDARNSSGDKRAAMKSINENKDAAIKGVLTADQYGKYEQHMKEMQEQRKAGGNMGGGQN